MSTEDNIKQLSHSALAALALAHHMNDMGAQRATIPVELDGKMFNITISRSLRKRRSRVTPTSSGPVDSNQQQKQQEK